jgi:Na+-driven multidrug efflux pump
MLIFSLLTHAIGALVNVLLNFFLIKVYSGQGAAVATLISYAAASYLSLFLSKRTRPFAVMMSKSFILPVRLGVEKFKK